MVHKDENIYSLPLIKKVRWPLSSGTHECDELTLHLCIHDATSYVRLFGKLRKTHLLCSMSQLKKAILEHSCFPFYFWIGYSIFLIYNLSPKQGYFWERNILCWGNWCELAIWSPRFRGTTQLWSWQAQRTNQQTEIGLLQPCSFCFFCLCIYWSLHSPPFYPCCPNGWQLYFEHNTNVELTF